VVPAVSSDAPFFGLTPAVAAIIEKAFGWVLLMILIAIVTARLYGVIEPLLPAGDWHAFVSRSFVAVTWSSLTWSLRRFASQYLLGLFSAFWW
jgi:hypothetical protein